MNSSIDNNVNLGGLQFIEGQKVFAGRVAKKNITMDINSNPATQQNNQIWFQDSNNVAYATAQANQNTDGSMTFSLTGRARSTNNYSGIGFTQYADGEGVSYVTEPSEAAATGTGYAKNTSQPATLTWVRNRTGFAGVGNRVTLSWALNSPYTMPADGLLAVTVEVGSQTNSTVTLMLGNSASTASNVMFAGHNGGGSENNKIPLVFPVRKGQVFFLNWNGAGSASVVTAYLWKFPAQGV